MQPLSVKSNNLSIEEQQKAAAANDAYVQQNHPNETFISTTKQLQEISHRTKRLVLPPNVKVAESRANLRSNEQQRTLKKELKQSSILSRYGNSVYLTPEYNLFNRRVTDAVVNGVPYEFRNITGSAKKIEKNFADAKQKGNDVNVFLHIERDVNMNEAWRRVGLVLERHLEYTGKVIVSIRDGRPRYWNTSSFRQAKKSLP